MIHGSVDDDGVPIISLDIGGRAQAVIVDTGFNGDLELPEVFHEVLNPNLLGRARSILAGGQSIVEDVFEITISFDGRIFKAQTTFSHESIGLIGTHLLRDHRLEIDSIGRTLTLPRADSIPA